MWMFSVTGMSGVWDWIDEKFVTSDIIHRIFLCTL